MQGPLLTITVLEQVAEPSWRPRSLAPGKSAENPDGQVEEATLRKRKTLCIRSLAEL